MSNELKQNIYFLNIINQVNKSVLYQDLDELCEALECDISDLLTRE